MNIKGNSRQGFSLIEVIVAVAILAVLSMPILLYFTNAAIHSAHGKHEQAADVAAQSVVEEIDSITDFDKLENELIGANGWEVATGAAVSTGPSDPGAIALKKNISIDYDGNGPKVFTARVVVDYGAYVASGGAAYANSFNSYNNPHLPEVYNDKNIVISEADESEVAIYDLYQQLNGSNGSVQNNGTEQVSMNLIKQNAKRSFILSIQPDTSDGDYCYVKGGIGMTYTPTSTVSKVSIKGYRVKKVDLTDIFFLFKPMDGSMYANASIADATFDFATGMDDLLKNLSISFVRQNTYVGNNTAVSPPAVDLIDVGGKLDKNGQIKIDQKITITASGSANWNYPNYYANSNIILDGFTRGKTAEQIAISKTKDNDEGSLWMVSSPQDKRIAKVYVYVFARDEYDDTKTTGYLADAVTSKSI